tara:strand:- start:254 stop:628 length:375 start_codon:yes stop_codon:yes gene_type:complete
MTTRGKAQPSMFSMEGSSLKPTTLQLSGDMVADLQDAFDFYDKDSERFISMVHFRNILTNFGFHNLSAKEVNDEIRKHDGDFLKRAGFKYDFLLYSVGYRYIKQHGDREEAGECFRLFDKRDKQ